MRTLQIVFLALALSAPGLATGDRESSLTTSGATSKATAGAPAVKLAGRVTDAAHILSAMERTELTQKLQRLEQATGHQMVVVTVPTLGGRDAPDFARDLGNSWGIGRKDYNDGVLLLIAPQERKVRIAVGYGLEATLTESVCQQIIDQKMLPRFRAGDLARGIIAGTEAVIAHLR